MKKNLCMKNWISSMSVLAAGLCLSAFGDIKLPPPDRDSGVTVLQALKARHSERAFSEKELPLDVLSGALWAANGFNRPDRRTNATGMNKQAITIYAIMKSGAYRYDAKRNELVMVCGKDLRKAVAGAQPYPETAPVTLLITADHSHMDSRNLCILDYPEVLNCLVRMPSIEPRTLNLFVKEEFLDAFPEIFRRNFGDNFLLLTREEVRAEKLFGPGEDRPGLRDMIGDYVALAVSDVSIFNTHYEAQVMPGGHAGLTAEESRIPLIVVETQRQIID